MLTHDRAAVASTPLTSEKSMTTYFVGSRLLAEEVTAVAQFTSKPQSVSLTEFSNTIQHAVHVNID